MEMLIKLGVLFGALVVAGIVFIANEMKNAPLGYEDESGFHKEER